MKILIEPDEYLKELKKKLNNPEVYEIKGSYRFHEKKNDFTGLFEIDSDGNIAGEIQDPNSMCSRHIVYGTIEYLDDITLINFVKTPTGALVDIYFSLKKSGTDKEIEGEYTGVWAFTEPAISLDTKSLEDEIKNRTHISLYKK